MNRIFRLSPTHSASARPTQQTVRLTLLTRRSAAHVNHCKCQPTLLVQHRAPSALRCWRHRLAHAADTLPGVGGQAREAAADIPEAKRIR